MKSTIKKIKDNKKLKALLFFGFYFIFFLVLALSIKNNTKDNLKQLEKEKKLVTIKSLYDKDFVYEFIIYDNDTVITFKGSKNSIDYDGFENKYFLNYININQILKKSKVITKTNESVSYEIDSKVLNELLFKSVSDDTNKDGINRITETFGVDTYQITMDLKDFMEKDKYIVELKYRVGEK